MGVTGAVIAGVLAAGTTAYSIKSSNDARSDAEDAAGRQETKQANLDKELRNRLAQEESDANSAQARDAARDRQRQKAIGGGRRSTILTSPLGYQSSEPSAGKTLLGQ